MELSKG